MSVNIGDTIRFSVGLLQQIYEEPEHRSELVTVREVREEADGSKTLVLERCADPTYCFFDGNHRPCPHHDAPPWAQVAQK